MKKTTREALGALAKAWDARATIKRAAVATSPWAAQAVSLRPYRPYCVWQRLVTGVLAFVMYFGSISVTFEQGCADAGILAAGTHRLSDQAWQKLNELARVRVNLSFATAHAAPIVDPTAPITFEPKITQTTGSGGGVPVVNITAPNAAGISLNQYQSFNIDPVGLILNNSQMSGTSLTGGDLQANPNLGTRTASVIVNQVTSTGSSFSSLLNGPLEVFGAPASVIIANPNGIVTRGMGVTNTIGLTLSTGTPQFLTDVNGTPTDFVNGRALGYDVRGGHIQIDGNAGVNGPGAGIEGTVGNIDLIGETIGINAPLYAGTRINAIAGQQFVSPAATDSTGTTYATSSNGSVNTAAAINAANGQANSGLAIDATAYGAVTAGQIQVIGTAAGMGVRIDSQLASNAGDLTISANGDVALAGTAAQGQASVQSAGNVSLTGAHVGVHDYTISASGDVNSAGTLQAGGKLAVTAGGQVNLANITSSGDTNIAAGTSATTGVVQTGGNLSISAQGLDGSGDVSLNGQTTVNGATSLTAARDVNVNAASTLSTLQATAERDMNINAATQTSGDTTLAAVTGNVSTAATVKSGADLSMSAGGSIQNGNQTTAQNNATLSAGQDIAITGSLTSGSALSAQAQRNISVGGSLLAGTDAHLSAAQGVDVGGVLIAQNNANLHAGTDLTSSGSIAAGQSANLSADHDVALTGKLLSNALQVQASNSVALADVQAGGIASISASGQTGGGDVTLNGSAATLGTTSISAARDIAINGSLAGGSGVALSAQRNVNVASGAQVQAVGGLSVSAATGSVSSSGTVDSGAALNVASGQDIILGGSTNANGQVTLQAGRDVTTSGSIAGQAAGSITATRDVNLGGNNGFSNDVSLNAGDDVNVSGTLQGNNLTSTAAHSTTLNNLQANGVLSVTSTGAAGGGDITFTGAVNGLSTGSLSAARDITVNTAGTIQTANALIVSAGGDTTVAGTVQSNGDLTLTNRNGSITSSGNVQSGGNLALSAAQNVTLASTSTTGALGDVNVTARDIALGGSLVAQGNGTLAAVNSVTGGGSSAFGLAATLTSGGNTNLSGSLRAGTVLLSAGGSANVQDVQGGSTIALSAVQDLQLNGALNGGAGVSLSAGGKVSVPGSIQAAGDLNVSASTGSVTTTGTIGGSGAFSAVAGTDINLGGTTTAALSTSLTAARDVDVSGTLNGLADGTLSAGRDIGGAGSISFATSASLTAARDIVQTGLVQGQSVQAQAGDSASLNNVESASTIDAQANGNAGGGDVSVSGALGAPGIVTLQSARDINVTGKVASGANINAAAQRDINVSGAIESVGDLNLAAQGSLNATGGLNSGGVLNASTGLDLSLGASTSSVGALTLNAGRDATLNGTTVGNAGASITTGRDLLGAGTQAITQDVTLNAGRNLSLTGSLQANTVNATGANDAALNNVASATTLTLAANGNAGTGDASITGTATAPGAVSVSAARDASISGALTGGQSVAISAQRNATVGGSVQSVGELTVSAQTGDVSVAGSAVANAALSIASGEDSTISGQASATNSVSVHAGGNIVLSGVLAGQQDGQLTAAGDITGSGSAAFAQAASVNAGHDVALSGALQGSSVSVIGANNAQLGSAQAVSGNLSVSANGNSGGGDVTLLGSATALGTATLNGARDTTVAGAINSGSTSTISGNRNVSVAAVNSAGDLAVTAGTGNASAGSLTTQGNLTASAGAAVSVAGTTTVGGNASLTSGTTTSVGVLAVQDSASIHAGGNVGAASIDAGQQASINAGGSVNVVGGVGANGAVGITAAGAIALGSVQAGGTLNLQAKGTTAPGDVSVSGNTLSGAGTTISAARDASLGGSVTSLDVLSVTAGRNLSAASSLNSNGTTSLSAATGNLNVGSRVTSGGAFDASAGGSIGLNSALVNNNTTLNAQGNIVANGVLLGLGTGTVSAAGQVSLNSIAFVGNTALSAGAGISVGAVQTAGSFQAVANSDVSLGSTTAVGSLNATSYGGSVVFNGSTISGGNVTVNAANSVVAGAGLAAAGAINVSGANGNVVVGGVSSNGDTSLHAGQTVSLTGNSTVVGQVALSGANVGVAGTLSGSKSISIAASGSVDTSGATLISSQDTQLSGTNVTMGNVIAGGSLNASASNQLTLAGSQVAVVGNASLTSGNGFYNASQVLSGGNLYVSAPSLTNAAGASLASTATTTLNATNLANAGLVNGVATNVTVGQSLTNVGGSLMGVNSLAINTGTLNNQNGLLFAGNANSSGGPTTGDLSLVLNGGGAALANAGGQLLAQRNLSLSAVNASLDVSQGTISQGGQLSITAGTITNAGTWNYGGQGASIDGLNGVTNTGTMTGSSPLTISTNGTFVNAGQVIGSDVTVNGTVNNLGAALLHADNNFTINGDTTNRGTVEAGNTLTVNGGAYDNAGSTTQSQGNINFNLGGTLQNTGGSIFAGNNISIQAGAVVNDQTAPTGQQTVTQTVTDPTLLLKGSIGTLTTTTITYPGDQGSEHINTQTSAADLSALLTASQAANGSVTLDLMSDGNWYVDGPSSQGALQEPGMSQVSQKTISLPTITQTTTTQTPGTSGVISAGNSIQLTAGSLSNQGGEIAASGDISLNIASLSNGGVAPTVQSGGTETVNQAQYSAFLQSLASLGSISYAVYSSDPPQNNPDQFVNPSIPPAFNINTGAAAPSPVVSNATWSSPTGMIAAGHDLNVGGGSLVNAGLLYAGNNVNISAASLTNEGGDQQNSSTETGCASGVPSSACGTGGQTRGNNPTTTTFGYSQSDATIYAGNDLVIAAGQINNTFGNLIAGHDLVIGGVGSTASSTTPAGSLNNTSGNIVAGNNITLNVSGAITNNLPPPVPVHQNYGSTEQYAGCMTAGGYKESYCEAYVDQQSGSSSVISAGNNLNITAGSLTNIGSLISAGNTATISVAGPVVNEAQTLDAYWHSHWVQETGAFSSDKRNDVWACGSTAECQSLYGSAYTGNGAIDPPTPVGNIAATIQAPNLSISSNGQILNIGNIIGTSVSLTGATLVNGITTANTYTPRVNAPSQVISLSPVNLPGLNISTPRSVGGALPTPVAGTASYVDGQIGSTSALGPQALLNNLPPNLQPSSTLFYYNPQEEDLLLQQSALQQTGQASFVSGLSYDSQQNVSVTDQEKAVLYGNAVAYAEANNLQLGTALLQTQINALTQPMLWYVEQTVPDPSCTATGTATCPTITALMPQIYLPSNSSAMAPGGNIVGQNVTLNFNQGGQGSILNTGTISTSGTLTVNTNSLTNEANQVNVGNIWSSVTGGYVDTTGTEVQPGGFMSAANMDLNVQTLQQIGGALQQLNSDGTVNQAGTQQVLAQLQQQLGTSFTQTSVQDNLHTTFVQAGGLGAFGQVLSAAIEVAATIEIGPIGGALVGNLAGQLITTGSINLESAGLAVAVAAVTQGIDGGLGLSSTAGMSPLQLAANNFEQGVVSSAVGSLVYGGSFGHALELDAITSVASYGATEIGDAASAKNSTIPTGSFQYVLTHAALGCAAGAAEGTGCAGGAIGGATSAAFSPDLIKAIDPSGAPLSSQQAAVVTAIAMITGGGVAGALGQNSLGAATAAENEALNNSTATGHTAAAAQSGGFATALYTFLTAPSQVGSAMVNGLQQYFGMVANTNSPQSPGGDPNAISGASNQPPTASGGVMVVANACPEPGACGVMTIPIPGSGSAPSNAILSSGGDGGGSTSGTGANATNSGTSGANSTFDTSITSPGSKFLNVQTDVTAEQFQSNLISNGYNVTSQGTGKNGAFTVLSNGSSTYTVYTRSSTGSAGAQYFGPGGASVKFSLKGQ